MSDTKMQMVFRSVMDLMELAMHQAGVKRLSITKRKDGGFDFKVRADDGGDIRASYSRMVEFEVAPDCFVPEPPK
jgi:hypothetical protein